MAFPHSLLGALTLPVISARRSTRGEPGARAADEVVCQCLHITQSTIDAAIADGCLTFEAISARTGAGSVCGGCEPRIRGLADWSPVEILEEERLPSNVLRLRFRPRPATQHGRERKVSVPSHAAGQHVLLRGRVNGAWLQRSYTLTSAAGAED